MPGITQTPPTPPSREQLTLAYNDQPSDFLAVTRLDSLFDEEERARLEAAVIKALPAHKAIHSLNNVRKRGAGVAYFPTCSCCSNLWGLDVDPLPAYLAFFGTALAHATPTCLPCLRVGSLATFAAWIISRGSPGAEALAATLSNVLNCQLGPSFAPNRNDVLPADPECQCQGNFSRLRWCDAYRPSQPGILDSVLAKVLDHTGNLRETMTNLVLSLPRNLPPEYYTLPDYHLGLTAWYLMAVEFNEGVCDLMPRFMAWCIPLEHASQRSLSAPDSPPELPPWCPDERIFLNLLNTRGSPTRIRQSLKARTYDEYVGWRLIDGGWIANLASVDVDAAREWAAEAATGRLDTLSGDSVSMFDSFSKARGLKEDRSTDATHFDRSRSLMTDREVHPFRQALCKSVIIGALDYLGCGKTGWLSVSSAPIDRIRGHWYSGMWSDILLGPALSDPVFDKWCSMLKEAGGGTDDFCPDGVSCAHPVRYHTYCLGETLLYLKKWWAWPGIVTSTIVTEFGEGIDGCRSRWQAGEGRHDPDRSVTNTPHWPTSLSSDIFVMRAVTHHAMLWASVRKSLDKT